MRSSRTEFSFFLPLTFAHSFQLTAPSMPQVSRSKILQLSLRLLFLTRPILKWSPKLVISAFKMSLIAIAISPFQLPCHKRPKQLSVIWITVITSSLVPFLRKFKVFNPFLTALPSESSSLFESLQFNSLNKKKAKSCFCYLELFDFWFLEILNSKKSECWINEKKYKNSCITSLHLLNKFLFINNACTVLRHYFINI